MMKFVRVISFAFDLLIGALLMNSFRLVDDGLGWLASLCMFLAYAVLLLAGKTPAMLVSGVALDSRRSLWGSFRLIVDSINTRSFPSLRFRQVGVARKWLLLLHSLSVIAAVECHGYFVFRVVRLDLVGQYDDQLLSRSLAICQSREGLRLIAYGECDLDPLSGVVESSQGYIQSFPLETTYRLHGRMVRGWRPLTAIYLALFTPKIPCS